MKNRKSIIYLISTFLLITVFIYSFNVNKKKETIYYNVQKSVFVRNGDAEEYRSIDIFEVKDLDDYEKESKINEILKEDTEFILNNNNEYLIVGTASNTIEKQDNLLSIKHTILTNGGGTSSNQPLYSSNIDIENGKRLKITDIIIDMDKLCDLLLQNKFEYIDWDYLKYGNSTRTYKEFSDSLLSENVKEELMNLDNRVLNIPLRYTWYLRESEGDGELVIVHNSKYAYEYAIKIKDIKNIINQEYYNDLK